MNANKIEDTPSGRAKILSTIGAATAILTAAGIIGGAEWGIMRWFYSEFGALRNTQYAIQSDSAATRAKVEALDSKINRIEDKIDKIFVPLPPMHRRSDAGSAPAAE